ncbi:MAG: RNA pseudouridine synthase, partial [Micrococcales bacterium]|nr:RNA pseudouridine synthase [Micrococcales bacterium]
MAERRELAVPDGLAGERVDVGLARLLGLSRARTALLAGDGEVTMDGAVVGKGDRLVAGAWLEVTLPPAAPAVPTSPDGPVPGLVLVH